MIGVKAARWSGLAILLSYAFARFLTGQTPPPQNSLDDLDGDHLADAEEQQLAETYAPIVFHSNQEKNWPTNVDDFLKITSLCFHDESCAPPKDEPVSSALTQSDLLGHEFTSNCGSTSTVVSSAGTLSAGKFTSFYLADVSPALQEGSLDSLKWTTYFHAYPNDLGGVTIQYWRFYAYNSGKHLQDLAIEYAPDLWNSLTPGAKTFLGNPMSGFHGGDWEGVQIILDAARHPASVWLLGHKSIKKIAWDSTLPLEGQHLKIDSEIGGHASNLSSHPGEEGFVRQETWTGGNVTGGNSVMTLSKTGPLVNIGEKTAPLNKQWFVKYSGLWGSPSQAPNVPGNPLLGHQMTVLLKEVRNHLYYWSSGYWGPAYNETEKTDANFITAWGHGMKDPNREVNGLRECWPVAVVP